MAEATREFAIAKTMEILRAYVRKIEAARGYFDCLSPEGCRIVENYDNNVDGQKTLLLKACKDDKFFLGMTDEMVIAYADVCRKLNDRFDLNVKKVYPIEKITADLSLFEKIKKAIGYSDILGEILEEVGDINALVRQMALVSGGLIALSFTSLGTVAEALGLALLLVGASFSGTELLAGITGLVKFFTEVYNAKTEDDLKVCGRLFGDAVAKIGVNGLFFVLSLFGLKKASIRHTTRTISESKPVSGKWTWKSFKENVLKIGEAGKTSSSNETPQILLKQNHNNGRQNLIWNNITKTADNIPNTEIPTTFTLKLNTDINYINPKTNTRVLWTNANATEHMGEYILRFGVKSDSNEAPRRRASGYRLASCYKPKSNSG